MNNECVAVAVVVEIFMCVRVESCRNTNFEGEPFLNTNFHMQAQSTIPPFHNSPV